MILKPDKSMKEVDCSTFGWYVSRVKGRTDSKFPNGLNIYDGKLQLIAQSVDGRYYVKK